MAMTKTEIMEMIQTHRDVPEIAEIISEIMRALAEYGASLVLGEEKKIPDSLFPNIAKLKKNLNLESESDDNVLTVLREIYRQEIETELDK